MARNVDVRAKVTVGDCSYCSPGTILFNNTEIGKYCSIGYNVQIGCPEHPTTFLSTSPAIYRKSSASQYCQWPQDDFKEPVKIKNDVWIGSNVIVLQGITIGDGAIRATGAVVTKNVEPYAIVGGVPAKMIRKRFDRKTEKIVSDSRWWDCDVRQIETFADELYKAN